MWSGAWNKRKLTSDISNRFLASSVRRAWDWWSGGCEFKPHWGQFLMKFILLCVTLDLPDNLTEMRLKGPTWKARMQMGKTFQQKEGKVIFRLGYFGTLTPSGEGYLGNKPHGTYEEIRTWEYLVHPASKRKKQGITSLDNGSRITLKKSPNKRMKVQRMERPSQFQRKGQESRRWPMVAKDQKIPKRTPVPRNKYSKLHHTIPSKRTAFPTQSKSSWES